MHRLLVGALLLWQAAVAARVSLDLLHRALHSRAQQDFDGLETAFHHAVHRTESTVKAQGAAAPHIVCTGYYSGQALARHAANLVGSGGVHMVLHGHSEAASTCCIVHGTVEQLAELASKRHAGLQDGISVSTLPWNLKIAPDLLSTVQSAQVRAESTCWRCCNTV